MQRWKWSICNGTLEILISFGIVVFLTCIPIMQEMQEMQDKQEVTFAENPQMKINSLKKQKHGYLIHTWSDKAFKGIVVNRALPSLLGGSAYSPFNF